MVTCQNTTISSQNIISKRVEFCVRQMQTVTDANSGAISHVLCVTFALNK